MPNCVWHLKAPLFLSFLGTIKSMHVLLCIETPFPFCLKVTQKPKKFDFFKLERPAKQSFAKHASIKTDSKVCSQESFFGGKKEENKQAMPNFVWQNSLKRAHVKMISRHNSYLSLLNSESVQRDRGTKKGASASRPELIAYQVCNEQFSKPRSAQKRTNGYALRKAVSEVKPCIDLRQVRRGRKTFQIPRIIPPAKRQLFGVRRLLSILGVGAKTSLEAFVKGKDSVSKKRGKVTDGNRTGASPSPKIPDNSGHALPNAVLHRTNLFTSARSRTRITRVKKGDLSSSSLSYALRNEIKASSQSRSRAVENKKRIYRVASANRGSIRMSWWL